MQCALGEPRPLPSVPPFLTPSPSTAPLWGFAGVRYPYTRRQIKENTLTSLFSLHEFYPAAYLFTTSCITSSIRVVHELYGGAHFLQRVLLQEKQFEQAPGFPRCKARYSRPPPREGGLLSVGKRLGRGALPGSPPLRGECLAPPPLREGLGVPPEGRKQTGPKGPPQKNL